MVKLGVLRTRRKRAANGHVVEYFGLPDFIDADTMEENAGENEDHVNTTSPEENRSPVDTMPENTGKNTVNVDLSTREKSISANNPSTDGGIKRSNNPSNAVPEEQRMNPANMAENLTCEKGRHGDMTMEDFFLN